MPSLAQFSARPLDALATAPSGFKVDAGLAIPFPMALEAISVGCGLSTSDSNGASTRLYVHVEYAKARNKYTLAILQGVDGRSRFAEFNLDRDFDSFKVGVAS